MLDEVFKSAMRPGRLPKLRETEGRFTTLFGGLLQALDIVGHGRHVLIRHAGSNHAHHLGGIVFTLTGTEQLELAHGIFSMLSSQTRKLRRDAGTCRPVA